MAKLITRTFEMNQYKVTGIDFTNETPSIIETIITADTEKDAKKAFLTIYGTTPAKLEFFGTSVEMYGIEPDLFRKYGIALDPETRKPLEMPTEETTDEK